MEKDADKIPVMKIYKRRKIRNPISRKEDAKIPGSPLVKKDSCNDCHGFFLKVSEVSDSEEDENICRSPVEIKDISYYFKRKDVICEDESESESDEEVLGDSDRDEKDWGFKFVVKKRSRTVTNPKVPRKTYFKNKGGEKLRVPSPPSVLHDPDFPLAAISKLALKTYNTIQAYNQPVNGFYFWTRFKARLPGQDAINFQANTFQERPDPKSNVVRVRFESVYPLPPSSAKPRTEQKNPKRKRRPISVKKNR